AAYNHPRPEPAAPRANHFFLEHMAVTLGVHSSHGEHAGQQPSPRWPAAVALLVIGCLYLLLSDRISVGPPWLTPTVIVVLLIPINLAHATGSLMWARRLALAVTGAVTVAVGIS